MPSEYNSKKYYWLKLKKDFFKRHDIKIIEDMDNGKDYILFYLKLLCESVDHNGNLRFSDAIPYNEKMLVTITNTNIDIVRSAMKVFTELKMIEILDDKTIFMSEVQKMIGCETPWAEKKRLYREKQKTLSLNCPQEVQQDINIELDTEKEIDKEDSISDEQVITIDTPKRKSFIPPTIEEVRAYCNERQNGIDAENFIAFYQSKGWRVGNQPMKDWKSAIITWEKREYKEKQSQRGNFIHNNYTQDDFKNCIANLDDVEV